MAILAELAVNLVMRLDNFEKGAKKGRKSTKDLEDGFLNAQKKAQALFKTLGVAGLTGAVVALGSRLRSGANSLVNSLLETATAIDKVTKSAEKLGITTESLEGLRHAAEQTGVTVPTLEMAMQRLARRTAEAAMGSGEAVKAFEKLRLDAGELAKLGVDEIFFKVAESISLIGDRNEQLAIVQKLLDSEGVALINTLDKGEAGLKRMVAEANKLMGSFSVEEGNRVAEFNDQLDKLSKLMGKAGREFVIDIAPAASDAVTGLLLVADRLDTMISRIQQAIAGRKKQVSLAGALATSALPQKAQMAVYGMQFLGRNERLQNQAEEIAEERRQAIASDQASREAERRSFLERHANYGRMSLGEQRRMSRQWEEARRRGRARPQPTLDDLIEAGVEDPARVFGGAAASGPRPPLPRSPASIASLLPSAIIDERMRTMAEVFWKQWQITSASGTVHPTRQQPTSMDLQKLSQTLQRLNDRRNEIIREQVIPSQ